MLLLTAALGAACNAFAATDGKVKIGVLTDLSGVSREDAGQTSVVAAELAAEEFGGEVLGQPIEIIPMDHASDKDTALAGARKLVTERKVDMITDLVRSNTAVAVQQYATSKGVIVMPTGAGASALYGEACSPLAFHWGLDGYAQSKGIALALTRTGGDSWYFVTADYAFGRTVEKATGALAEQEGAKVLGASRYPYKATDVSGNLLEAMASGAKVIGLASGGADTQRAIRQSYEVGLLNGERRLAAILMFVTDVRRVGLYAAAGLQFVTPFYWSHDERTKAFAKKVYERTGTMPTMIHAGTYSATLNYLRAVKAAGTDEPKAVAKALRGLKIDDAYARNGHIRADGQMVHDLFLVEVKAPRDTEGAWDYYKLVQRIKGDEAYAPLSKSKGKCGML
jgi:branched-chain amino acid transport system substrate-binding protein